MKKVYWTLALVVIAVLFYQCQKDLSYIGSSDPGVPVIPDPITANIQGNIVDENDQPATGVAITAGTSTAMTDANGYFHINSATLDKNTTLITAQKDGYYKGYRVFAATSGCNQVMIKLIKRNLAGTITSAAGGVATLSNGAKVSLPANGVMVASTSTVYSGDVKVYASYIDPKSGDIAKTVPGSFVANDKNGKRVILSSYGMLAAELESASGEKLQMKSGSVATLTVPIPSAALSSAPATISLWYMDEQTGIWTEEGTATKQGNNYVGDVKHFSFWNCDFPYDGVTLSFTLHTPDDLPIVNASVQVVPADSAGLAHGYTDSLGQVNGLVPANKNLTLEVMSPCGTIVYSQSIPPLSQNTDLGTIKVTGVTSSFLTFTGTLLDCNNAPVTKGYAIITFSNATRYAATDANGQFTTTYITCNGTAATSTVTGIDENSQQQSETATVAVISPVTNAGSITACGVSSEQHIDYTLDGTNYTITSTASDSLYGFTIADGASTNTYIYGSGHSDQTNYINFKAPSATSAGTYPVSSLMIRSYGGVTLVQPFNATFTNFPTTAGGFYEGTLSGQFTDSASAVHNLTTTFRIRRGQ